MRSAILVLAVIAAPALAQDPAARTIQVTGSGLSSTPPDLAVIDFWLRGEGRTADAASTALATTQRAVTQGLEAWLGRGSSLSTRNVTVIEVRAGDCDRGGNNRPRLSDGDCAVVGYLATLQASVRTPAVAKAGTAAGLAARLGARDARLQSFQLADEADARRRATALALTDARDRATAIAAGSGARLGPVLTIREQGGAYGEIVVSANRMVDAPAPPAPPPPVEIEVSPRPIETRAQVFVTYAILP